MEKIYKNILKTRALMLVVLASIFAFGAHAQTIDPLVTVPPTAPTYYVGDNTDASVEYTTTGSFDAATIFYLHTGNSGTDFTEDDVIAQSSNTAATIDFEWTQQGNITYYLTAAVGSFESEVTEFGTSPSVAGGLFNGSFNRYDMNREGIRRVTTDPLDLSSTDQIEFQVSFNPFGVTATNPIRVQFSTNGTDWTNMTDADNSENAWDATDGAQNLRFVLTSGQKSTTTQFRIIQEGKSDYTLNEESWNLSTLGADFRVEIGGLEIVDDVTVNTYTVDFPSTDITVFNDNNEVAQGFYRAGEEIEVEGTFTGATGQVDTYEYTAVFSNGGDFFLLEGAAGVNNVNDISVTGTIPADLEYGLNWSVELRAYTGTTPTLGNDEDLLNGITLIGANSSDEFDQDEQRSAETDPLVVQTVTGGSITFEFTKETNQLSPAGTELVLEYNTDGSAWTQIGDPVSLNADTSEPFEFDISGVSAAVSNSTQFRVRQLSNNGLGLDVWTLDAFNLITEGNIIVDQNPIDYNASNININAPVIALDPVDVPAELIFPGDEVELTYNITEGAYPAGTTIEALLVDNAITYNVGTSSLITPGDAQDHTITITIPQISAGTNQVRLVPSTDQTAGSGNRNIPISGISISITEVTSSNGIIDGTTDVFYPGDEITVAYDLDGSIGTGGELFLEAFDYGDPEDADDNDWVAITTVTGAAIDGTITATLPTDINYEDNGGMAAATQRLRLRAGNGVLANGNIVTAEFTFEGAGGATPIDGLNLTNQQFSEIFDQDQTLGNNPQDIDEFIGSGERSSVTIPFELPFGGRISLDLFDEGYDGIPQVVQLQASNDGTNFTTIDEQDYDGGTVSFSNVSLPASLWGEEVSFKFIYNADGAAAEFENVLSVGILDVDVTDFGDAAVSASFDISDQLRLPTISLEVLENNPQSYLVGEEVTVEYTTEGTFPANTGFALIFDGRLDEGNGSTGGFDDGDVFQTVVATSTTEGLGSFTFNVPDFAFEFDGTDSDFDLYDRLTVVAYDATGGASYEPNEEIDINEDDQFLVIEGTDEENGNYTFDLAGDRSLLTEAFDLSGASQVFLQFTFAATDISMMDNVNTIPVIQTSIDAGASFQNLATSEDTDPVGTGALYLDNTYTIELPSSVLTNATHFRWYQALNLGSNQDRWGVSAIKVILVNGNEISSFYAVNNDEQPISLRHPSADDYELTQVDPNDAVFSGESVELSFNPVFETSDPFPEGVTFEFLLWNTSSGSYVQDPTTNEPLRIGTLTAPGTFSATIPNDVANGSYRVDLVVSKEGPDGQYFYIGDDAEGADFGATLDVFLRVARTTLDFDTNDVLYAGSTVTFNVTLENAETFTANDENLFSNLVIPDFDGTDEDLIVTSQEGIVTSFTVDLPPFVRETSDFEVRFSEGSALGEDLTIIGESDLLNLEDDFDGNFINGFVPSEFITSFFGNEDDLNIRSFNGNWEVSYDIRNDSDVNVRIEILDSDDNILISSTINGGNRISSDLVLSRNALFNSEDFQIRIRSLGEAVGEIEVINLSYQDGFDADPSVDIVGDLSNGTLYESPAVGEIAFEKETGRGTITTTDLPAADLAEAQFLEFTLDFDEVPANMLDNQFLILEYSIDEGATYTQLGSYPDADEEETLVAEEIIVALNDDIRGNDTRFRWRQEERAGIDVGLSDISITTGRELEFDYQAAEDVDIVPQQLLVTSVSSEEACLADAFTLGFEVRGRMGADNIVGVEYSEVGSGSFTRLAEEFNAFEGTGTIEISLPGDLVSDTDNNKTYEFRLIYDDETFEDLDSEFNSVDPTYEGNGPVSDENIEIVAPANPNTAFSFTNPTLCANEDVEVTITTTQQYFMYEVLDAAGTVLGSTVFDPDENGSNVVNIGTITEATDLSVRVTAMSESGALTCNSVVSEGAAGFDNRLEPLADYELYGNNGGANSSYSLVQAGAAITVCENGAGAILDVRRLRADGSVDDDNILVEWFVDDVNNPVAESAALTIGDVDRSGAYFARVTDGSCVYTTESIQIDVEQTPAQPSITVVSGSLEACFGSDPVVLEAPEGFAYYQWDTPKGTVTTRTVEADTTGDYSVEVSNIPFDVACESDPSAPVTVVRYDLPELSIADNVNAENQGGFITEGAVFDECENFTVSFYDDEDFNIPNGTIEIIRDGASVGFAQDVNQITLEESGTYSFTWTNDENANIDCSVSTVSFTLNIVETPDRVEITSTGDLAFCEGEGAVTLTAPEGFAEYVWLRSTSGNANTFNPINTTDPDFNAVSANTIELSTGGFYAVEVANLNGCNSAISNVIEVSQRATPPLPEVSPGDGVSVTQEESVCGSGAVTFAIAETEADFQYQLINASTGQPSGDAVRGSESGDMFITSAAIEENTLFYLEISYADGTGCTEQYPNNRFTGRVNNVILEMEGNSIVAEISGGAEEITWFRNDVELRNRANQTSISVIDAATYSVEVDFGNGCVITSNAVAIDASVPMQTFFGELEVNSYPNPTTSDLNIDMLGGDLGEYTITLMNMSGQVVVSKKVNKADAEFTEVLDLSAVEKGVYNLRIQRGNTVENVRIVKQ